MVSDKDRLDWLERHEGFGLISDDFGRWAVSGNGQQNLPTDDGPFDCHTSFFVEKSCWHQSVREAIDTAIGISTADDINA